MDEDSQSLSTLMWAAIGHYLGGEPRPGEAPVAVVARGLGYAHEGELLNAMKLADSNVGNHDFHERYARAIEKLFAKFGFDLHQEDRDAHLEEFRKVLIQMQAGRTSPVTE
jgi:hypothetical protein